jgi:DNA repair protein RecN (Recombination protein N)
MEKKQELSRQIEMIAHKNEYLAAKEKEIAKAFGEYGKLAAELSKLRRKHAPELDQKAMKILKELMLENAVFHTEITAGDPSVSGNDRVEFMISMNKGEDLKPLSRTASGGELSRLMLGLKVIFTGLQGIQTVIFDEIDTGVSGPVATAIGRKMHALSESCQVFSVTHLAQAAACADYHYLVRKASQDLSVRTSVTELDEAERISELALIASGEVTETSLKAAEELYRRNRS